MPNGKNGNMVKYGAIVLVLLAHFTTIIWFAATVSNDLEDIQVLAQETAAEMKRHNESPAHREAAMILDYHAKQIKELKDKVDG